MSGPPARPWPGQLPAARDKAIGHSFQDDIGHQILHADRERRELRLSVFLFFGSYRSQSVALHRSYFTLVVFVFILGFSQMQMLVVVFFACEHLFQFAKRRMCNTSKNNNKGSFLHYPEHLKNAECKKTNCSD